MTPKTLLRMRGYVLCKIHGTLRHYSQVRDMGSKVSTTDYNLDNGTDSLAIVAVPCRYSGGGQRGKGGQLS